jgi:hypothetical protein
LGNYFIVPRQYGISGEVAIFAKAFLGIPTQQATKITRPLMPSPPLAESLLHSFISQQVDSLHHTHNDST